MVLVRIGEFEISRVEEMVLDEPTNLFAGWTDGMLGENPWLPPDFYNRERGVFLSVIQTFIVRTPDRTIIIDTGGGNDKERPLAPRFHWLATGFPDRLRAAGVEPDRVDTVIMTHLHVDHVGWNTRLVDGAWVPMFPNAQYIASAVELEVRDPKRGAAARPPASWNTYNDSVQPIVDAGMMRAVQGDETLFEGIDLMPIPGHAPGQMAVRLRSGGQEAMFIADVMHNPIQVYHPDWNSKFCEDPDAARRTRLKILDYAAANQTLIIPGHFGAPHCGYVRRTGDGFAFEASLEKP